MKKNIFVLTALAIFLAGIPCAHALFEDKEKSELRAELEKAKKELETVTTDRDNVLKQAKNFLREKEMLEHQIQEIKGQGSQSVVELDSLKKENEILKSEMETLKSARLQDAELQKRERAALEARVAEQEARADSIAQTVKEFTPEKVQALIEDRDRLAQENKNLAARLIENERQMEEMRRSVRPLELDREELYRLRAENKELLRRIKYVSELETRNKQLLKENSENRERIEVMKAKFKDAVPGLAKASRISQKMMRENADMHYNLGTVFLHNKQYKEAIKEYEQVLELRPNDPETHYNLGVLYDDFLRDREKALHHYQKYLAINPKAPDAKKVETYLLSLELEQKVR